MEVKQGTATVGFFREMLGVGTIAHILYEQDPHPEVRV